ncbi:transporter [Allorhizobium sp. BGMRC 0089]|uniref:SphA family protein n=1 Tax=Allorhizobium sonneratiae TaxID=2934936 RepID=UPI00203398BD|nr:transporter [Allorhizobium sonneratiae]MCM2292683.1 transporter [Allorhizobium sonneratiae]
MTRMNCLKCLMLGALLAGTALDGAFAAENGNTQYSPGAAQFFAGGIPPISGFYFLNQTSYYTADRMNDAHGNKEPIPFKVHAISDTMRFLYVSDLQFAGGRVWAQLVVPVVNLNLDLPTVSSHNFNIADMTATLGMNWTLDRYNSLTAGLDVGMPTGYYNVSDPASIGLNHWSIQPTVAYHYYDPKGLEIATSFRMIFNTRNNDTDYKTGTEIDLDYAVGWNINQWRVGAVGYYLQQISDDTGPTAPANGNRGKGLGLGPSLNYSFKTGQQLGVSWVHDVVAENRPQGDTLWLNFATKF